MNIAYSYEIITNIIACVLEITIAARIHLLLLLLLLRTDNNKMQY